MNDFSKRSTSHSGPPQFSLLSLMIVFSIVPVTLAFFFGVGRMIGMTNAEIASSGLTRFLFSRVPKVIVWVVGLVMSLHRLKKHSAFVWSSLAFAGFIAVTLLGSVSTMLLIHYGASGTSRSIGMWFTVQGIVFTILNVVCWVLLLVAIFKGIGNVGLVADKRNV